MSSISKIPLDILGEILVRLPAESLCRSRAVSKGFRSLIDDPCFVRAHTNKNYQHQLSSSTILLQNNTFRSFVGACYSLDLEALTSCRSSNTGQQAFAATPLDFEFITSSERGLASTVAACDGLVLTQNKTDFTIWNPLTHERLDLPPEPDFSTHDSSSLAFGLGYDATTDDYKAVVVIQSVRHTHVYSLKQDTWRRIIDCPLRDGDSFSRGAGVFVCGALNWLSTRDKGRRYDDDMNIIALNLGTEKFSLLQMPRRKMRWSKYESTSLNVVGGCLAFFDSGFCMHLDVWVMKDYGHGDSWIKLFSIEIAHNYVFAWSGFLKPICFIRDKLVFLQDSCQRFFLFDVETKSFKSVKIICGTIIGNDSYLYAKRLFVGTIFRLHANCGVRKPATTKKKASASLKWVKRNCSGLYSYAKQKFAGTICCCNANCGDVLPTTTTKKKKASSSKDIELVFYTRRCNKKVVIK